MWCPLSLAVTLNAAVPSLWVCSWFEACALLHQVSSDLEVVVLLTFGSQFMAFWLFVSWLMSRWRVGPFGSFLFGEMFKGSRWPWSAPLFLVSLGFFQFSQAQGCHFDFVPSFSENISFSLASSSFAEQLLFRKFVRGCCRS